MDPNYFFVRNTTFLARQCNWSNMFKTITTCRLSHYFRVKTCSSFLSHSQVFHLMFVIKFVTVLSGKYPANFTRIPDSAGCLHFPGYRIVLSGSDTSLFRDLYLDGNNILYCQCKIVKIHCRTGNYCTLDKDEWIMVNG